ncbi:MAG TPA: hypothetical protein EYQ50_17390 [Verrucomicrobiales bacterium]|nr:hypothetical protein [Verrucomicrobiales bacterium]
MNTVQAGYIELGSQRSYGGDGDDILVDVFPTEDGGYLLAGYSDSNPGFNKSTPHLGGDDFWVVKTDRDGAVIWDQVYGGPGQEILTAAVESSDGGYLLVGYSSSEPDGIHKTSEHYGLADYWVVRIDPDGLLLWDASFGSVKEDRLTDIMALPDGGFLLGGSSLAGSSGNKEATGWPGPIDSDRDIWLIRITEGGAKRWEQTYGGIRNDVFGGFMGIRDQRSVFISASASVPDEAGNRSTEYLGKGQGDPDLWMIEIGGNGDILNERGIGNSRNTIKEIFSVSGRLHSPTGSVLLNPIDDQSIQLHFLDDDYQETHSSRLFVWTGELKAQGFAFQINSGILFYGTTNAGVSGSKHLRNFGKNDIWVLGFSPEGNRDWQASFGTDQNDEVTLLKEISGEGFLIGGVSEGEVNNPSFGKKDFWLSVLKVNDPLIETDSASNLVFTGGTITMKADVISQSPVAFQWFHNGLALTGKISKVLTLTNVNSNNSGEYSVQVSSELGSARSSVAFLEVFDPSQATFVNRKEPERIGVPRNQSIELEAPLIDWDPVEYHWFHDGIRLGSEQLGSSLFISDTTPQYEGSYSVLVRNPITGQTLLHQAAEIRVSNQGFARVVRTIPTPDFNGDGLPDLLFQHNDGRIAFWSMDEHRRIASGLFEPNLNPRTNWQIRGAGDMDQDGQPDLIFQHRRSKQMDIWFMDGIQRREAKFLSVGLGEDADWTLIGTGDFNEDGQVELGFQHESNTPAILFMNRNGDRSINFATDSPSKIPLFGLVDFNGNGISEFGMIKYDRRAITQSVNRIAYTFPSPRLPGVDLNSGANSWKVVAIGDYDDDFQNDLVMESAEGQLGIWFMNGNRARRTALLAPSTVGPGWSLVGPK